MRSTWTLLLVVPMLAAEGEECEPATDADSDGWIICTADQDQFSGVCDCDDSNALIYPGAKETNSKYDDDCDGAPEWTSSTNLSDKYYVYFSSCVVSADGQLLAATSPLGVFIFTEFGNEAGWFSVYDEQGNECSTVASVNWPQGASTICGYADEDQPPDGICLAGLDEGMMQYSSTLLYKSTLQYCTDAITSESGGLLVAGGFTDSVTDPEFGPLLFNLTSEGQVVWTYSGQPRLQLQTLSVTEGLSGATFVGGLQTLVSSVDYRPWIERISSDGLLESDWFDWPEIPIMPHGMLTPWDGDIVLYGTDEDGCFAVGRFTEDLDPIWLWQRPSGECLGVANAGVETFTGDLAIVGAQADGSGGWCGLAYVLSPFGEMLIESRPCQRDGFFGVVQMPDGGFVMTGQTDYKEGFILRMDKYLNVPPGSTPN